MLKKISPIEKMLIAGIAFTMFLLCCRIIRTHQFTYLLFIWNTVLAVMPFLFSRSLINQNKLNYKSYFIIAMWLLFFPNAPYIITDLFHLKQRELVPYWFDLLLVVSAAWNGLLLGIISLMQVENFLSKHLSILKVNFFILSSALLCGYGIYIGRFLRFNSWDIIANPDNLLYASAHHVLQPREYIPVWGFTFLFAVMFCIIYFTLKQITHLNSYKKSISV